MDESRENIKLLIYHLGTARHEDIAQSMASTIRDLCRTDSGLRESFIAECIAIAQECKSLANRHEEDTRLTRLLTRLSPILDGYDEQHNIQESIAVAKLVTREFQEALDWQTKAMRNVERCRPNSEELANAKSNLGLIYLESGNFRMARDILQQALALKLALNCDAKSVSITRGNFALSLHKAGDYSEALLQYEISENAETSQHEMNLFKFKNIINRAALYIEIGRVHDGISLLRSGLQSLPIEFKETPIHYGLLESLGNAYLSGGNIDKGETLLRQVSNSASGLSPYDRALLLANLGGALFAQEQYRKSLETHFEAFQRLEKYGAPTSVLATQLGNIAECLSVLGGFSEAAAMIETAISLLCKAGSMEHLLPNYWAMLAFQLEKLGKDSEAFQFYELATSLLETRDDNSLALAHVYTNFGTFLGRGSDLERGVEMLKTAAHLKENLVPFAKQRVVTENNLLSLAKKAPSVDTPQLLGHFKRAWTSVGMALSRIQDISEARLFLEKHAWISRQYGDELASQGDQLNAFLVRQQAENLYLRLTLARRIRDDQADGLRQTIEQSQAIVDATLKRLENPDLDDDLRTRIREEQAQAVENRDTAQVELDELLDRVLGFQDVPLDQAHEVLGESGVYLSYYVQPKSTILYVVWKGDLKIFNLPVGEDEPAGGDTHRWWHEILPDPSDGEATIRFVRPGRASEIANLFFPSEVQKILWEAVDESREKGEVPLVAISRDGVIGRTAMNHLPISRKGENAPLASIADVTYINSLGHLKLTKEYKTTGSGAVIVGVADHGSPGSGDSGTMRGAEAHHNLPLVKEETEKVAKIYGVPPLLDHDAQKSLVVEQARTARVIALASHGGYSPDDPLSAHVVLFPPDQVEGWLAGYDLAQDKFQASLMTASCCVTGQAGAYAGRELASFGYAAQLAGIRCVVVSQWPVAEKTAKEFMITFHGFFAQGLTVGESYRRTMAELGTNENWATFVIIGDPRVSLQASA